VNARLLVDWPRCIGRGLCHELLPDHVRLDEWGYPIVVAEIEEEHLADARAAVRNCPRAALRLG
jgi:ferredoxin